MYGQSQTSFLFNSFHKDLVHGGAACQSSREGSCSSAEPRILNNFFIFSSISLLIKQSQSKSANNNVFLLDSTECQRPASQTSGAFFVAVFYVHTSEKPLIQQAYFDKTTPRFVAFRGIFGYSYLNSISENRTNALSVFIIHRILSFMSKFPLYAVFWGFFSVHNYPLFIKKASVAAGYSGNGVPVICNSLKHSEIWPTQKGSIPFPCSCLVNPLCVISTKREAVYSGKGAPEAEESNTVCGRRKLHGSSPCHGSINVSHDYFLLRGQAHPILSLVPSFFPSTSSGSKNAQSRNQKFRNS